MSEPKQVVISVRLANYLLKKDHKLLKIIKGKKEGKGLAFLFLKTPTLEQDKESYRGYGC